MKNYIKTYILGLIMVGLAPISAFAQAYNPTVASQQAQVAQILALVNSLPSNTNDQLTQKIQLLQQALQLQLAVNSATGYSTNYNNNNNAAYNNNSALYGTGNGSNLQGNTNYNNNYGNQYANTPVFISTLYPSTGNIGTRINLQGNNIAVNDQVQITVDTQTFGTPPIFKSAGVVDPGLGFTFPATLSTCAAGYSIYTGACLSQSQTIPITTGSYGVRIMKPDGYTVSNTQYFQVNTGATSIYNNNNNGTTWAMPASSFALNASSFNPTSVVLSWPNATNLYGSNYFRVLEILPNNQMNSITTTSNKTYQIDNLIAGSVHTYLVYGCSDSACNQVLSQSVPVMVSLLAGANSNYNNGLGAISSTVTTQATSITGTSAMLNGQVNTYPGYNYGVGSIQTWFEYAVNLNNTATIQRTNQVTVAYQQQAIPVTASAFSLTPNTLYQFRLGASINNGTPVYSNINTFYTSYY